MRAYRGTPDSAIATLGGSIPWNLTVCFTAYIAFAVCLQNLKMDCACKIRQSPKRWLGIAHAPFASCHLAKNPGY